MAALYCISGLGADERVFSRIDTGNGKPKFINWLQPENQESIQHYAERMRSQITEEDPVLIGLSFGGMMAIEIAKQMPVKKLILLSSVKSHKEIPFWMRSAGRLKMDRMLPNRPLQSIPGTKALRPIQNYFLGAHSAEEKQMANEYRDNVDPVYLRWSISQILNWKNDQLPARLYQIHGDKDHIFPIKNVHPTHIIKNAGHFMVMNHYQEINRLLSEILQKE